MPFQNTLKHLTTAVILISCIGTMVHAQDALDFLPRAFQKSDSLLSSATTLMEQGEYRKASGILKRSIEWSETFYDPKTLGISHLMYGLANEQLHNTQLAMEHYLKASILFNSNDEHIMYEEANFLLADLFYHNKNHLVSLEYIKKVVPPEGLSAEKSADIYILMGLNYYDLDSARQAEESFLNALEYAENISNISTKAKVLSLLSNLFFKEGDYKNALKTQFEVLDLRNADKDLSGIYNNIGAIYNQMGHNDSAVSFFSQALKQINPTNEKQRLQEASMNTNLGSAYSAMGEYEKAEDQYIHALETYIMANQQVDIVKTYYLNALNHFKQGKYQMAIKNAQVAVNIIPDEIDFDNERDFALAEVLIRAYKLLMDIYEQEGREEDLRFYKMHYRNLKKEYDEKMHHRRKEVFTKYKEVTNREKDLQFLIEERERKRIALQAAMEEQQALQKLQQEGQSTTSGGTTTSVKEDDKAIAQERQRIADLIEQTQAKMSNGSLAKADSVEGNNQQSTDADSQVADAKPKAPPRIRPDKRIFTQNEALPYIISLMVCLVVFGGAFLVTFKRINALKNSINSKNSIIIRMSDKVSDLEEVVEKQQLLLSEKSAQIKKQDKNLRQFKRQAQKQLLGRNHK